MCLDTPPPKASPCIGNAENVAFGVDAGAGQKTPEIFVLDHPTKSDVTSGLNGAAQLVSQREKMAFRLGKIFLYLQTIRFVSFHTEDRNILKAHFFDF